MIKDSGNRTKLGDTGFVRDIQDGKGRMDLLPWYAIIEVSKHCEEGAAKYGERNIDLGALLHSLLNSGARHLAKYIMGENDEDHLRAACWNLLWALQQRTTHPELNDMPWGEQERKEGKARLAAEELYKTGITVDDSQWDSLMKCTGGS